MYCSNGIKDNVKFRLISFIQVEGPSASGGRRICRRPRSPALLVLPRVSPSQAGPLPPAPGPHFPPANEGRRGLSRGGRVRSTRVLVPAAPAALVEAGAERKLWTTLRVADKGSAGAMPCARRASQGKQGIN